MSSTVRDAVIKGGKTSVLWLRDKRRLERLLARVPVDGDRSRFSHRLLAPTATLSPWYDDEAFLATYEAVVDHTLVDIYRCWDLWSALAQVAEVPGDVLEVGVWRGGTGALMAERCRLLGLDATVVLADTFRGVVGAGSEDPWYRGGEHADTSVAMVEDLLGRFPGVRTQVYDSAKATLDWAWPRLGVGGLVVFDDYGFYECEGVAALGAELMAGAGTVLRGITSLNGHLTLVKLTDGPLPTC